MKNIKNILLSFLCTLFFPVLICDDSIKFSNSFLSVALMAVLFLLFRYSDRQCFGKRINAFAYVLGFALSVMTAFGYHLEAMGEIAFSDAKMLVAIILFAFVFKNILCCLWSFLEEKENGLANGQYTGFTAKLYRIAEFITKHPLVMVVVMFACWTPCWLGTFPGGFRYDAASQFIQYYQGYSGDFPLLNSFIITRLIVWGAGINGSCNTGIAIYTAAQMLLLSAMFAHILYTLAKQGINKFIVFTAFIYCAAFPAIHLLATCTVRDVMFCGLLTYSVFLVYLLALDCKKFMSRIINPIALAVVLVLTLLSRNNNTGIVMPLALLLIGAVIAFLCRKDKRSLCGAAVFAAVAIGGYIAVSSALLAACQPFTPANANSSLALFSQSLARAYFADGENWSEEDRETFKYFFPDEELVYVAENGDPTKFALTIADGETDSFMQFWAKKGREYPAVYLNAVLANSRQMWFPDVVVDGYNEAGKFVSFEKCYFTYNDHINEPGVMTPLMPKASEFYQNIGLFTSFEKVPVISMLFSIGFHFWLLLFCIFYAEYRRCRYLRLPLAILLAYAVISSFVPLVLLRYFAALFFAFPMIMAFCVQPATPFENAQCKDSADV